MKKIVLLALLICANTFILRAENYQPAFSTAGFYALPSTGRTAYNMNPAWRFHKGPVSGADMVNFDDSKWDIVTLPNPIEILPLEASGCVNYQGEVWYRKHFTPEALWRGKRLFLHFEGIMGKSRVWVNGKLATTHYGGFLPVIADVTNLLKTGKDNVITVCADNSDDSSYPPGKAENVLDYAYFGGIYRDCWLVVHNNIFITDPNYENTVAGGGLFVSYDKVGEQLAQIRIDAQVRNASEQYFSGRVYYELFDKKDQRVWKGQTEMTVPSDSAASTKTTFKLKQPLLWSPETPNLYKLCVYVKDAKGRIVDGYSQRIGIRSIEFRGKEGFWLNGKPYPYKLIGANRHQDFAVVGDALSNSMHWRDAKKLRDAGLKVIRNAHYPQDPAFMDACDELGLFVIVNTPGWQFWNDAPIFGQRVYSDIHNMVRRDRNHASVWLWEPILNETHYPSDFAKNANDIVHAEYPYAGCYTGCDDSARGNEYFPVHFAHPANGSDDRVNKPKENLTYFTREWGDNVDDWSSHNSPSRAARAWGEIPMLVQAQGYAKPDYQFTCYDALYRTDRQHVGGCLWHSFDHQRGYHPDPFYGGLMDAFRQPKYSYYMFCAQRPATADSTQLFATGPMVYIANAMTPFSQSDVTVYSNCDTVRLTVDKDGKQYIYSRPKNEAGMPSPIITFKDAFHVMDDKALSRSRHQQDSYLLAEGIIGGEVVASHIVMPARRPTRLILWTDSEGLRLKANGSDMVTVIAAVCDDNGNIKRLNDNFVKFEIFGEGTLVADAASMTNPQPVKWGTAPILVKATTQPGSIRIRASVLWQGTHTPVSGELVLQSYAPDQPLVYDDKELQLSRATLRKLSSTIGATKKNLVNTKDVEKQQAEFE